MNNVYLIGYRGAGKSTVAPLLALRCKWTVMEMDEIIQQREAATISEIFSKQGEDGFRRLETSLLREIAGREKQVVSTGGGIILREENRNLLQATGLVVWLKASAEAIWHRLQADTARSVDQRPSMTTLPPREEISRLVEERSVLYAVTSHLSIDTETHKLEEIADLIFLSLAQGRLHGLV